MPVCLEHMDGSSGEVILEFDSLYDMVARICFEKTNTTTKLTRKTKSLNKKVIKADNQQEDRRFDTTGLQDFDSFMSELVESRRNFGIVYIFARVLTETLMYNANKLNSLGCMTTVFHYQVEGNMVKTVTSYKL